MNSEMQLGNDESTEVWFLPNNRAAYAPRVLTTFATTEEAREYSARESGHYAGDLELVRVTMTRQRVV
jgi:hypothetical protein